MGILAVSRRAGKPRKRVLYRAPSLALSEMHPSGIADSLLPNSRPNRGAAQGLRIIADFSSMMWF